MIRDLGPDAVDRMVQDSPLGRLGSADEVAHLAAWLCSDASRFNTGAIFDMSAGAHVTEPGSDAISICQLQQHGAHCTLRTQTGLRQNGR